MNDHKNCISLEEELSRLREENVRLRKLLATHGIAWEAATAQVRSPSLEASAQAGNRLSTAEKVALFRERQLGDTAPHVLLATGRLVGEGFDHPPLDTLVLAMPISWKGTLQQYAGRLHREHTDKDDVRIYDYVEADQAQLTRMWDKRLRGYRDMGYEINTENHTIPTDIPYRREWRLHSHTVLADKEKILGQIWDNWDSKKG